MILQYCPLVDWNNLIVGKLSPHIYVDSHVPYVAKNSEEALYQELALATHLGLCAITFKLKGNLDQNMNLARIFFDKLGATPHFQVLNINLTIVP